MGLFDKKNCSICGAEIGLLGNRKLADGNLCKNCADKLSPLFDERRQSTVDEIRDQLAYRKENAARLADVHPTKVFGTRKKIYVDEDDRLFFVSDKTDWQSENPDIISFDQVMDCRWHTTEHSNEIYFRDPNGKRVSYNPPKYEYEYEFDVEITVDSPYFHTISLELTNQRPVLPFGPEYKEWEAISQEVCSLLKSREPVYETPPLVDIPASAGGELWVCSGCGRTNSTNFCPDCGQKRPEVIQCGNCGWQPENGAPKPRFCPNCGTRFPD